MVPGLSMPPPVVVPYKLPRRSKRDEAAGSLFAAGGPEGGGLFTDRAGDPIGCQLGGETKRGHGACGGCHLAAAVAENLLHGGAILQAKVTRVRVKKYRVNAAEIAEHTGLRCRLRRHEISPDR